MFSSNKQKGRISAEDKLTSLRAKIYLCSSFLLSWGFGSPAIRSVFNFVSVFVFLSFLSNAFFVSSPFLEASSVSEPMLLMIESLQVLTPAPSPSYPYP